MLESQEKEEILSNIFCSSKEYGIVCDRTWNILYVSAKFKDEYKNIPDNLRDIVTEYEVHKIEEACKNNVPYLNDIVWNDRFWYMFMYPSAESIFIMLLPKGAKDVDASELGYSTFEIRNTTNKMYMAVDELKSMERTDSEYKRSLAKLQRNLDNMTRILNGMNQIEEYQCNMISINSSLGNICMTVEDTIQKISKLLPSSRAEIISDINPDGVLMAFDEIKVKKIIVNIVACIIKLIEMNGGTDKRIFISSYREDSFFELSFKFKCKQSFYNQDFYKVQSIGIRENIVRAFVNLHKGEVIKDIIGENDARIRVRLPIIFNVDEDDSFLRSGNIDIFEEIVAENFLIEFSDIVDDDMYM